MPEISEDWLAMFPRQIRSGGSEGYCGALDIVLISKPFTPGEDAVLFWAVCQDASVLVDIYPLDDGRDVILLQRLHTGQSLIDAVKEQQVHMQQVLKISPRTSPERMH